MMIIDVDIGRMIERSVISFRLQSHQRVVYRRVYHEYKIDGDQRSCDHPFGRVEVTGTCYRHCCSGPSRDMDERYRVDIGQIPPMMTTSCHCCDKKIDRVIHVVEVRPMTIVSVVVTFHTDSENLLPGVVEGDADPQIPFGPTYFRQSRTSVLPCCVGGHGADPGPPRIRRPFRAWRRSVH